MVIYENIKSLNSRRVRPHISFSVGHDNIAELLIQNGANANAVGPLGYTALILAAQKGTIYFSLNLLFKS